MYENLYKYPRTPHLPWSASLTDDDVHHLDLSHFVGKEVVVTEKMDGENTSLYRDNIHARSLDGRHHPSRDWVKSWHASIAHDIPEKWRLCGENMYAQHSIIYDSLESYFYLFSIWDASNQCLSWDETKQWAELLECPTPTEFYRGIWDESAIRALSIDAERCEGYVVRLTDAFHYDNFNLSAAKYVRPKHVQTDQHWMHAEIVPNKCKATSSFGIFDKAFGIFSISLSRSLTLCGAPASVPHILIAARKGQNLTQTEAAERCQVSASAYKKWERHHPIKLPMLIGILYLLGCLSAEIDSVIASL